MSKNIDEKVVEMRFDNNNFEANVKTSLSTLDKLKQKLNLSGASKGLEDVSKASKKVDFSHMESSLAALEKRFSTTGIIGMTFIQNMTNGLIQLAKRASSFSIGGIIEGGKSRSTKIENARFQIKGLLGDTADAAKELDAIMENVNYGVQDTAYGLDAAASVAAQLAASGMKAGDGMKHALRGISGVAAMTNSTYEDIGRIYTTVAGNGRLMGDQLLQLSSRGMNAAATLGKYLNKSEADVRQMVSKGQISFEIFSKAMDSAFGEHAKDANKTLNGTLLNIKAALSRIGADFFSPLMEENGPLVKLLNSVRERINEIRKTLQPLTTEVAGKLNNFFTSINKWFTSNNILRFNPLGNMASKIQDIKKVFDGATAPVKSAVEAFNKASAAVKDYEKLVDEIILGKWKNQPVRQQLLEEAGYNYYHAQNMVNERLGSSVRHADDYVEATTKSAQATSDLVIEIENLSDEQMRNLGFTEEQIKAMDELRKMSKKTGIPIKELIELISSDDDGKDTSVFSTRYLLFRSLKNIGETLISVLGSLGKAFAQVFLEGSDEGLFNLVAAFHRLTQVIRDRVIGNAEKLTNTLKGLFSIIHIIGTFLGAGFKIALNIVSGILSAFNISILDFTSNIGEAIYKFDRWLTVNHGVFEVFKAIGEAIGIVTKAIGEWISKNVHLNKGIGNIKNLLSSFGESIKKWVQGLKETDNIPKYLMEGLVNGIKSFGGMVYSALRGFVSGMIELVKNILQIHSPSKVFFVIGGFIMAGLLGGLQGGFSNIQTFFQTLFDQVISLIKSVDLGAILAGGLGAGVLLILNKALNIVDKIANVFNGLANLLSGIGDSVRNIGRAAMIGSVSMIIKSLGTSLLMLAGSLFIISKIDPDRLWQSVGALATLGVIIGALAFAVIKLSTVSQSAGWKDLGKTLTIIYGVSLMLIALTLTLKSLSKMDPEQAKKALNILGGVLLELSLFLLALAGISALLKAGQGDINSIGNAMIKITLALYLMTKVIKSAGKLKRAEINKAKQVMFSFTLFIAAMVGISKFADGEINQVGKLCTKVSGSLVLMVAAIKLCGLLKSDDIKKSIGVMVLFAGFISALTLINKYVIGAQNVDFNGISKLLISFSASMLVMSIAMKMIGLLKISDITKSVVVISLMAGIMGLLAKLVSSSELKTISGNNITQITNGVKNVGKMMIEFALSMLILTTSIYLLGKMDTNTLIQGVATVTAIGLALAAMIKITQTQVPNYKNNMTSFLMLVGGISLIAGFIIAFANQDKDRLTAAASAMVAVIASMGILMYAFSKLKFDNITWKNSGKILGLIALLATMAGPLWLYSEVLKNMGDISNPIEKATALAELTASMSIIIGAFMALGKLNDKNKLSSIVSVITGVAGLIGVAWLVLPKLAEVLNSMSSTKNAKKNVDALVELIIGLGLVISAFMGIGAIVGGVGKIAGIIGIIGGVIGGAAGIGFMKLMTFIVSDFADILNGMSNTQNSDKNADALVSLIEGLALVIAALMGLGTAGILTLGIGVAGYMLGLEALNQIIKKLDGAIDLLNKFDGVKDASTKSKLLMNLIKVLVDMCVKLAAIGPRLAVADTAIAGLSTVLTNVGGLLVIIGYIMEHAPKLEYFIEKGLGLFEKLSEGLGKVFGAFFVGLSSTLPIIGSNLSGFMNNAEGFVEGIKKYDNKAQEGAESLIKVLKTLISTNIWEMLSKLLTGGLSFTRLGSELSKFAGNLTGFIETMESLGSSKDAVEAAKMAVECISELTKANFLENLSHFQYKIGDTTLIEIGESLGDFAGNFKWVGKGLKKFKDELGTFNSSDIETFSSASRAIQALTEAAQVVNELNDGAGFRAALSVLYGDEYKVEDLRSFGQKLGDVGIGLRAFCDGIQGKFSQEDLDKVNTASDAIKALAGAASSVKEIKSSMTHIKGLTDGITKDNAWMWGGIMAANVVSGKAGIGTDVVKTIPLDEFVSKMIPIADKLKEFMDHLGTFDDTKMEKVQMLTNALSYIRDLAVAANGSEGELDLGDKIKKIGTSLQTLPMALQVFTESFNEITTATGFENGKLKFETIKFDLETFKERLSVFKVISDSVNEIPEANTTKLESISGAMEKLGADNVKKFIKDFSDNSFNTSKFDENIRNIANGLNTLTESFSDIDEEKKNKIESVKGILDTLSQLTSTNEGSALSKLTGDNSATSDLKTYGENLKKFAENLSEFINKMIEVAGEDKLDKAIANFNELSKLGVNITEEQISKISQLSSTMQTAATQIVSGFVNTLVNQEHKELLTNAAKTWAETLKTALESHGDQGGLVSSGAKTMVTKAITPLSSDGEIKSLAVKIGEFIGQGVIDGMSNKSSAIFQKAKALGQEAIKGLKEGTDEHSPSKEGFKAGRFVNIGFINGLDDMANKVYSSGYGVGKQATIGLTKSIAKISSIIRDGVDTQPTIRPVLDLSDVENGINSIGGLLSTPSVNVFGNLSAISNGMNSRRQNGGEDIVSAIDKLGKNLGNTSGDTYNIDGIRINSDAEVADAVNTLIRAARIERRK